MEISDFLLFKKNDGFQGYARYFNLKSYECRIKKKGNRYVVLVRDGEKWIRIGFYYPLINSERVRGAKDYELVGMIWTSEHIYHLLKDGNRYIGL